MRVDLWSVDLSDMVCDEAAVLVAGGFRADPLLRFSLLMVHRLDFQTILHPRSNFRLHWLMVQSYPVEMESITNKLATVWTM